MNHKLRIAAVAALIGTIGVTTGAALAGAEGRCRPGASFGKDIHAMADGKLARLHEALKLAPGQEAAWKEFSDAILLQADRAGTRIRDWREGPRPASAIERLERGQQGLEQGRQALTELTATTKRFHATLTPEQQQRFDDATRHFGPGRFGHRDHLAGGV